MRNRRAGFTIVEILIAVVIIGLTMVFVLGAFSQGFLYFLKCKDTTRMHKLGQYVVEMERAKTYYPPLPADTGNWKTFGKAENAMFRYRIDRTYPGDPPSIARIDCSIEGPYEPVTDGVDPNSWQESMKSPRFITYNFTTFIARRPFSRPVKFRRKPVTGDGSEWVIKYQPPAPCELNN
jgi:prepilin-type N-terminal cleavage/methylation domain-containing protein